MTEKKITNIKLSTMNLEQLGSIGFEPSRGTSLTGEEKKALEKGFVIEKKKSLTEVKFFIVYNGSQFSRILLLTEKKTVIKKLDRPSIYDYNPSLLE